MSEEWVTDRDALLTIFTLGLQPGNVVRLKRNLPKPDWESWSEAVIQFDKRLQYGWECTVLEQPAAHNFRGPVPDRNWDDKYISLNVIDAWRSGCPKNG